MTSVRFSVRIRLSPSPLTAHWTAPLTSFPGSHIPSPPSYCITLVKKEAMEKYITECLDAGLIAVVILSPHTGGTSPVSSLVPPAESPGFQVLVSIACQPLGQPPTPHPRTSWSPLVPAQPPEPPAHHLCLPLAQPPVRPPEPHGPSLLASCQTPGLSLTSPWGLLRLVPLPCILLL